MDSVFHIILLGGGLPCKFRFFFLQWASLIGPITKRSFKNFGDLGLRVPSSNGQYSALIPFMLPQES